MDNIRDQIYIGALLHDIGKFYQRADLSFSKSKELKGHIKNNNYLTNYSQSGYPTHQHSFWTLQFLENKNAFFEKLHLNTKDINIPSLAAYHHKPRNQSEAFIQLADWWASGMDRSKIDENDLIAHNQKEKHKKVPLVSIFSSLKIINRNAVLKKSFKLKKLSVINITPDDYNDDYLNSQSEYKILWDDFYDEFDKLPTGNFQQFTISLYYLLKKYLWFIPASTIDFPDSSLFQHSKLTAAFAQCFYDYQTEKMNNAFNFDSSKSRLSLNVGEFPVILLGIDLSGIQSFLYDISSKYAAKSLRGRSFYLQMIIEGLSWKLIEITKTTPSHIVYNSGGKFFIVLPNTGFIKDKVRDFISDTEKNLWNMYDGQLNINQFLIPFAYENLKDKGKPNIRIPNRKELVYLGELWQSLHEGLNAKKNSKYKNLFINNFDDFFVSTPDEGGDIEICSVTGKEISKSESNESKARLTNTEDEDLILSKEVLIQKEIGESLIEHSHITFGSLFNKEERNVFDLPFDLKYSIRKKEFIPRNCISIKSIIDDSSFDFLVEELNTSQGFRFFGGNTIPLNHDGKQKTFEELAGLYKINGQTIKENNYPRLGFLRMDVDNLGRIFLDGFEKANQSFSDFATLSGMLDLFFAGYLNTLRKSVPFENDISIIYSGGDDIFAVGSWDKIIEFASAVREEFRKFTGRDDLSVSGGIEIFPPRFPVSKAADASGQAESRAKQFQNNSKDALCLFGIPIKWGEEWEKVSAWKNKILEWLEKEIISKGLLMALFRYYDIYNRDKIKGIEASKKGLEHKPDLSWKWNAAYNLARRAKALDKSPDKRKAIDDLKNLIFTEINENNFRFEAFAVAMRWAELLYRMKKVQQ